MSETRRKPSVIFTILALIFIIAPIGGVCWWMFSPKPQIQPPNDELTEIVCTGRVDVFTQIIALEPAQAGRIVYINDFVSEGAIVTPGQVIVKLDDAVAQGRKISADVAVELAKIHLKQAQLDESRFPKQLEARDAMAKAATARVLAAEKALEQREKQATVAPLGKAEVEAMKAQIAELKQIEVAELASVEDMKSLKPQYSVDLARQRLKAAEADLALAKKAVDECTILSPSEGRLLRLSVAKGGFLYPGSPAPAIVFAPTTGGLIVRAEVDQEFLGRVKEGMKATIQDENRTDGPVFEGKILKVSGYVAQRRSMLLDPGEINDVRTLECIVGIVGDSSPLIIGQRMRVRITVK